MIKKPAHLIVATMITLGALTACDSTQKDWQAAQKKDTPVAYENFLSKHPQSDVAAQARQRLDTLKDESDWNTAREADSLDAYQVYREKHHDGAHVKDAIARIDQLTRTEEWNKIKEEGTEEEIQAFIARYPGTTEASQAQKMLDAKAAEIASQQKAAQQAAEKERLASLPYYVQLAAIKNEKASRKERDRLEKMYGATIGAKLVVETPEEYGSGNYYRIRTVPLSETDAKKVCKELQGRGQACIVAKRKTLH